MAYTSAQLIAKYEQIRDGLVDALVSDSANPKPDYTIGNQTVSRQAWRESLLKQIQEYEALISDLGDDAAWEVRSTGYT